MNMFVYLSDNYVVCVCVFKSCVVLVLKADIVCAIMWCECVSWIGGTLH